MEQSQDGDQRRAPCSSCQDPAPPRKAGGCFLQDEAVNGREDASDSC